MKVEIDQSGKLEQLNTDTVVAYANGKSNAVLLKVPAKRTVFHHLKRSLIPEPDIEAIWFAIVIYLLIQDVPNTATLVIDEEYTGKDQVIERALIKLLNRRFHGRWLGTIRFQRIGKSSPAHTLAYTTYRGKHRHKVRRINAEEVLRELQ